ncbi:transcription antitermination factor NusB [Runella slithyformis]|uniref:Transcription antitermination protein NusB n=1 Tax=Runella slithyformis (strain ATCC 29530 / DSM 19594 / LMG 11500 / NCIMB 11436 / LSU 4) TaxID=761193 RepID=A0A7U3ZLS4_RUNSL|nr:transcription antitermination factor NusB [Runella slithyformis]AEI49565.1 NusB antitermination factor [Runella slithyformis DSM 19594]
MLSRRHLRVKVLQSLYALQAAREADYQLALDFISESFRPDLNSMTPQDPRKLEGMRKMTTLLLEENYRKGDITQDEDTPPAAFVTAKNALRYYQDLFKKDKQRISRQLTPEVEAIYNTYLLLLQLFIELGALSQGERERQYDDPDNKPLSKVAGFDTNRVVIALTENKTLENEFIRRGITWGKETTGLVRTLFRDVFRNDDAYRAYCETKEHTPEEDLQLMLNALKEVILKNEEVVTFFELNDLYWSENGDLARKMANKSLKSTIEETGLQLVPLTDDWEEDRFFMEELFEQTITRNDEIEQIIAEPLKNWDLERLAPMDYLILKMSVSEMMSFPGIPVKVTINEAIEIAKEYSTPKSGKFVNGILDTLSKTLIKEGKIRKSGRGLLDNK